MKELRRVTEKIKKVLIKAERTGEEFPWIVDQLSLIKMYDVGLPITMVLGIIDEFIEDVEERKRIKALEGFDEEHVQRVYDKVNVKWNDRNIN
jgi:Ribonuclease G/E